MTEVEKCVVSVVCVEGEKWGVLEVDEQSVKEQSCRVP